MMNPDQTGETRDNEWEAESRRESPQFDQRPDDRSDRHGEMKHWRAAKFLLFDGESGELIPSRRFALDRLQLVVVVGGGLLQ